MANEQPAPQFKKPAEASPSPAVEARVFTMPERYRHGAQASLHQPKKKQALKKPVEVKAPNIPPPPKSPPKPMGGPKKKALSTKKLLFVGLIVLVLLAVGGFFLIQSVQKGSIETTKVETPVPRKIEEDKSKAKQSQVDKSKAEQALENKTKADKETEVFKVDVVMGLDSDSDGLTDTEEKLIYNTDSRLPDTDSDGFLDGNEVYHRYNPAGAAPGTLIESGVVKLATAQAGSVLYRFYYPSNWSYEDNGVEIVLDATTGEGFRITFGKKSASESLEDWVKVNAALGGQIRNTTKNGFDLIQSENQLLAYVDLGEAVIIVEYDTGIKSRVDYLQTLQMMLNSVDIIKEGEEAAAS